MSWQTSVYQRRVCPILLNGHVVKVTNQQVLDLDCHAADVTVNIRSDAALLSCQFFVMFSPHDLLMLTRMSKISTSAISRRTNANAQKGLPRALLSIAALSVNVAMNPHVGRNNRADLEILEQAVRLTKPWIEAMLEEILQHFPSLAIHDSRPAARRPKSLQDKGLLGVLLSLLSAFWKVSGLLKSGNGVPRQARVLRRLHSVLSTELASAEREIERLKALVGGKPHARRRRQGTKNTGTEDEWEDVAAVDASGEAAGSNRREGTAVEDDTVLEREEVSADVKSTKTQRQSQSPQRIPTANPPGLDASEKIDHTSRHSDCSGSRRTSRKTLKSAQNSPHSDKSAAGHASPKVDVVTAARQQDKSPETRSSSKDGGPASKATRTDRSSHKSPGKSSKSSKERVDSRVSEPVFHRVDQGSQKPSTKSSAKSHSSQPAKDKELWSPATSRSGTASTHSKRSTVMKEVAPRTHSVEEAADVTTHRERQAVATGSQEAINGQRMAENGVKPTKVVGITGRSHASSRAASEAASPPAPTHATEGSGAPEVGAPLQDNTQKPRSNASSRTSKTSRSKRHSSHAKQDTDVGVQAETGKPAISPSSHHSAKSDKSRRGTPQAPRSLSTGISSPVKSRGKSGSASPGTGKHSTSRSCCASRMSSESSRGAQPEASAPSAHGLSTRRMASRTSSVSLEDAQHGSDNDSASSASASTTKSKRGNQYSQQTTSEEHEVDAAKRSESRTSSKSDCHCQQASRPRRCHHAGSLASSGCDSKAWSCEVSLDAQGVLQLKAEHFHRRADGC